MEIMGDEEHSRLFESGQIGRACSGDHARTTSTGIFSIESEDRAYQSSKGKGTHGPFELIQAETKIGEDVNNSVKVGKFSAVDEMPVNNFDLSKVSIKTSKSDVKWITVFVGNLPPFANKRWLFDNFQKIGKVTDYYVSGRVSKFSKKPFGFVRFLSLQDANRAVDYYNGAWVDGFRREVELARFPRRMMNEVDAGKVQNNTEEDRLFAMGSKLDEGPVSNHNAWINPVKSFAQVVAGRTEDKLKDTGKISTSRIKVKAKLKECGWLTSSVVAKIKWGASFRKVRNELLAHIKGLVVVSKLGIRKVIMAFNTKEDRNRAIISGDWLNMVEEVREWSGELVCADKLWNISCVGIPITAWNIESFRTIADTWGSLVNIDYSTLKGEDYSVANFVLETEADFSNTYIDLLVGNDVFQVQVTGVLLESQPGYLGEDGRVNEKEVQDLSGVPHLGRYSNVSKYEVEWPCEVLGISSFKKDQFSASQNVIRDMNEGLQADANLVEQYKLVTFAEKGGTDNDFDSKEGYGDEENVSAAAMVNEIQPVIYVDFIEDGNGQEVPYAIPGESNNQFGNRKGREQSSLADLGQAGKDLMSSGDFILSKENQDQNEMVVTNGQAQEGPGCVDGKVDTDKGMSLAQKHKHTCVNMEKEDIDKGMEVNACSDDKNEIENVSALNVQVGSAADMEKEVSIDLDQDEPCLGYSVLTIPSDTNPFDGLVNSDSVNAQQGLYPVFSPDGCQVIENQIKEKAVPSSGISGDVELEVKAMMDLGNSLDIPNAYQFEEAVREASMEEIMNDSSSIGMRVKSKRKYAGKSKVQFGCRLKKG